MMTDQRITDLERTITAADHAYYNGRESGLTDFEYDGLVDELKALAPEHPLLTKVGAPVPVLTKARHTIHMGSQFKATNEAEFRDWAAGLDGLFPRMVATLKLDGFSLALYYQDGLLQRAVTRGDGFEGEDITANAIRFKGIPVRLKDNFTGAVRGEGVMLNEDWLAVDPDRQSNPRNLAAGIARRKDGTDADRISFFAFDIESGPPGSSDHEVQKLRVLDDLGLKVVGWETCDTLDQAVACFNKIACLRKGMRVWIDGVIFKVNSLDLQQTLGIVDNRPKGQIAWKFEAECVVTQLLDVVLTVGHTGKVIPTAVLKPVQIGGTTVGSALLNNWEEIARLDVALGDQVRVIKAGDIIPKVIGVDLRATGYEKDGVQARGRWVIPVPDRCPVCGGAVGRRKNTDGSMTADLYCLSDECDAKATGKIKRWIKSLDIQGIGDEVLVAMTTRRTENGEPLVGAITDLYALSDTKTLGDLLVNGRKLGTRRAASILAEIDKTRTLTIDQFLGSLGVRHLGKRRVQMICDAEAMLGSNLLGGGVRHWFSDTPGTDASRLHAHATELGIPNMVAEIQADLDAKRPLIEGLLRYVTVKPRGGASAAPAGGRLAGKVFCFTGWRPDEALSRRLTAAGGRIAENLTKSCTHLVQADPTKESGKSKKARGWGLAVIGKAELEALVGGAA